MSEAVAVLAGGRAPEREVSLRSGHRIAAALRARGFDAFLLDPAERPLVETLSAARVSACYVALHGKEGEDGTVQRVLEQLDVPYTGSGPFSCHVTFDKILAKEALDAAGVATPPWAAVQEAALRDLGAGPILGHIARRVGLPAVVKPSRAGSAMGLSFVEREVDLPAAVMSALSFADSAVIERRVVGTEVAAGMIGSPDEPLPLVEIVPKSGVFDYASRYTAGATEYFAPARLPPEVAAACHEEAARAFRTLGLRDVSRADIMIDAGGRPWIVDVNVSPGMTDTSLLPMAAQAAGIEFPALCERVLRMALARGARH
ncbi:MAG TPA: D-alanine--D-alanine ligase [Actinomycetota bacterium]|nr:D-alanine--D-alanine ligase [Actinomycetota bacterium]